MDEASCQDNSCAASRQSRCRRCNASLPCFTNSRFGERASRKVKPGKVSRQHEGRNRNFFVGAFYCDGFPGMAQQSVPHGTRWLDEAGTTGDARLLFTVALAQKILGEVGQRRPR